MGTQEFFMPAPPSWLSEKARATPERAYMALALLVGCVPLPFGERIYSISWEHDGEECSAHIGGRVEAHRPATSRRGAASRAYRSTVLAIYRLGDERVVVTDRDPRMEWHDGWDNPLRYLRPTDETLFSAGPNG